jgi:hypothetical protein
MLHRPLILGLIGLGLVVIGAGAAWVALLEDETAAVSLRQPATEPASPSSAAPANPAQVSTRILPSFDVVRVNPAGDTVIAGRAAPNAVVRIMDGERELGRVTADARGEWVFVPTDPLPPGARELSIIATNGTEELRSEQVVVLVVPDRGQASGQPLVVATPRDGGRSRILQGTGNAGRSGDGARLALDTLDYDNEGQLMFSGRAPAGARVQVYIDNRPVGRATAGPDGTWELSPADRLPPGLYTLRIDELAADGRVATRVELPFMRSDIDPATSMPTNVMVQPGDSLWRIARKLHGRGMAYVTIYEANREQIRDPDLIYPGQVFNLSRTN